MHALAVLGLELPRPLLERLRLGRVEGGIAVGVSRAGGEEEGEGEDEDTHERGGRGEGWKRA